MKNDYIIVIPARLQSTRLAQKPLRKIIDWELINSVIYTASYTDRLVVVATDDQIILENAQAFIKKYDLDKQVKVVLTSTQHQNGTDRLAEVVYLLNLDNNQLVVNIQGDEPFFNPLILDDLVASYQQAKAQDANLQMATICQKMLLDDVDNPNAVKVVMDNKSKALYFSRSPIPYPRTLSKQQINYYKHAGVYCYSAGFIKQYKNLVMTPLASIESLEQLKVLENGYSIYVMEIAGKGFIGVDTQEDLDKAITLKQEYLQQHPEFNRAQYLAWLQDFCRLASKS